jgi:hypothetical protein
MRTKAFRASRGEAGSSLAEVLVALVVTAVGTLSMATLIAYGTRLQTTSRDTTLATAVGRQQIERLRMLPPLNPSRAAVVTPCASPPCPPGSLTADVPNYFTVVPTPAGQFRCRWTVAPGPAGTKQVQMVVLRDPGTFPVAELEVSVWP